MGALECEVERKRALADRMAGREGQAVAVIVRPDVIWSRSRAEGALNEAAELHRLLDSMAEAELPVGSGTTAQAGITAQAGFTAQAGITAQYAEDLIASIRAARDSR